MTAARSRRAKRPLNEGELKQLAMAYVGRFSTTRAKLRAYLQRKIQERGWEGRQPADLLALSDRLADLGLIDDADYAEAKARALAARGYGKRRLIETLRGAGVAEDDGERARRHSDEQAVAAALKLAERRRIGPFGASGGGPDERRKAIGVMVRAGHSFELARAIAGLPPGIEVDPDELADAARRG
jgi:regulatory protein